jgi:Fe2+ transport system protein FeoA
MTTLGQLRAGKVAVIVAVRSKYAGFSEKYAARGIVPGAEVAILQHGDPIAVALENTQWAMSREEANHIDVVLV